MNANILEGIGYLGLAVADVFLKKDYALAMTDALKALGDFGVHTGIVAAMQAPSGQAAPQFKEYFKEK